MWNASENFTSFFIFMFLFIGFTIVRWNETVCYSFDSVYAIFYRVFKRNVPNHVDCCCRWPFVNSSHTFPLLLDHMHSYDPYQNLKKRSISLLHLTWQIIFIIRQWISFRRFICTASGLRLRNTDLIQTRKWTLP